MSSSDFLRDPLDCPCWFISASCDRMNRTPCGLISGRCPFEPWLGRPHAADVCVGDFDFVGVKTGHATRLGGVSGVAMLRIGVKDALECRQLFSRADEGALDGREEGRDV